MERENRVDKVMSSLEGMERADAPRGSFAGIQQRLAAQRQEQPAIAQEDRFGWLKVAAVTALIVCANAWAVTNFLGTANDDRPVVSSGYSQLMTDFNLYENEF